MPIYDKNGEGYTMSQLTKHEESIEKMEALKQKYHTNNGQALFTFFDKADNENKCALYRFNHKEEMPEDLAQLALGKRLATSKPEDLNNVIQMEHVRNYAFSQHRNEAKDEFIIQVDNNRH